MIQIQGLMALIAFLILPFQVVTADINSRACNCKPPRQGAQGDPGLDNFVDAFGSDYHIAQELVFPDILIPNELVNANVNITHVNDTFIITESGTYFLFYGVSNRFDNALAAAFVNDMEIPGTRIGLVAFPPGLTNVAVIFPFFEGDVIDFRPVDSAIFLSHEANGVNVQAATVQVNLIRVGPILVD